MQIFGADINGINGQLVRFTASIKPNATGHLLLGNAKRLANESFARACHAIKHVDGVWNINNMNITIDMKPAKTPKESAGLALPIAIILLLASLTQDKEYLNDARKELLEKSRKASSPQVKTEIIAKLNLLAEQEEKIALHGKKISSNKNKYLLIGSLDISNGQIESPSKGTLGMISAARNNFTIIVPEESRIHAALVNESLKKRGLNTKAYTARDINEVWNIILGDSKPRTATYEPKLIRKKDLTPAYAPDLSDIKGLGFAKEAMQVSIAGGHNIILVGPSGCGKTMLSKASLRLLPRLTPNEIFEVNKIYSACGELDENEIVVDRPFREANSETTEPTIFGGGNSPTPGEISLSHKGILLFDEINLFSTATIEKLRLVLQDKRYKINRVRYRVEYPANFIFIAAMNPCKCGNYGLYICPVLNCYEDSDKADDNCRVHGVKMIAKCHCMKKDIEKYKSTLSLPILDRIDLKVLVTKTKRDQREYASSTIARSIERARDIQRERYHGSNYTCNGDIPDESELKKHDKTIDYRITKLIDQASRKYDLSNRTEVKLLLVSRTIADINESEVIEVDHVSKAIKMMGIDNEYFQMFR